MDLTQPIPGITPRQRLTFGIVALVCAATRFLERLQMRRDME